MTDYIKSHPDFFISNTDTLRDALKKLDSSAKKNLFLVENDRLKAALSDGDIRRWLLNGGTLDAAACVAANYHPKFIFDTERGRVNEKFREYRIDVIPVVDENLIVLDVIYRYAEVDLSDVRIRELSSGDLPMISEFFDQMAGDTRAMFNRNDVNRIRANDFFGGRGAADQVQFAAVVTENGVEQMVGYVFLWDLKTRIPWLGIAVRESWKGKHLGRMLLEHAERYAANNGCGGIMLSSVPANIRAHSLYTRMGYDYSGTYLDGEFLFIKRFAR